MCVYVQTEDIILSYLRGFVKICMIVHISKKKKIIGKLCDSDWAYLEGGKMLVKFVDCEEFIRSKEKKVQVGKIAKKKKEEKTKILEC